MKKQIFYTPRVHSDAIHLHLYRTELGILHFFDFIKAIKNTISQ